MNPEVTQFFSFTYNTKFRTNIFLYPWNRDNCMQTHQFSVINMRRVRSNDRLPSKYYISVRCRADIQTHIARHRNSMSARHWDVIPMSACLLGPSCRNGQKWVDLVCVYCIALQTLYSRAFQTALGSLKVY